MKTEYIPYTYLIGWSKHNLWYYGARYINNPKTKKYANPSDLWVTYFTSSKYVKIVRGKYGDPDVIQIRKTFDCEVKTREWEIKVLKKLDVKRDHKFINRHNGDGRFYAKKGHKQTEKSKIKRKQAIRKYYEKNPPSNFTLYNLVTGEVALVTNIHQFSKERGLDFRNVSAVFNKKEFTHKNWSLSPTPYPPNKVYKYLYEGKIIKVTNLRKFCEEQGLNVSCMNQINNGKQLNHKGYSLVNPRPRKTKELKTYIFSYKGEKVEIIGLTEFCKTNDLSINNMWAVLAGKRKTHKGYSRYDQAL